MSRSYPTSDEIRASTLNDEMKERLEEHRKHPRVGDDLVFALENRCKELEEVVDRLLKAVAAAKEILDTP